MHEQLIGCPHTLRKFNEITENGPFNCLQMTIIIHRMEYRIRYRVCRESDGRLGRRKSRNRIPESRQRPPVGEEHMHADAGRMPIRTCGIPLARLDCGRMRAVAVEYRRHS